MAEGGNYLSEVGEDDLNRLYLDTVIDAGAKGLILGPGEIIEDFALVLGDKIGGMSDFVQLFYILKMFFTGGSEVIQSASYILSSAAVLQIAQSVFDLGSGFDGFNLQGLKIHQIKQSIEKVQKKIDKMMLNPLHVAYEMFKTGYNEIEAKRFEEAQKSFTTVIEKANEGLENLQDKSIKIGTFKFCVHALKMIMCSKINKYCYNLKTNSFLPYFNLTKSDQMLIAKELENLSNKCIALKENVKVKPTIFTNKKEEKVYREESQNILNNFLQTCYPYMSNGFEWTRSDSQIKSSTIKIQVKTVYLPDGEENKSKLQVGVMEDSNEIITVCVWVSDQKLYVQHKGLVIVSEEETDLMEVEFGVIPVVIFSTGGAAQHCGEYLGQYNCAGEYNGRPYYRQFDTVGNTHPGCLFSHLNPGYSLPHWYVGSILGDTEDHKLFNPVPSDTFPATGWKFKDIYGKLHEDTTLVITFGTLEPCEVITVKLSGDILDKYPEYEGEYHHNEEYSQGREVYTNKNNKLLYQLNGRWRIDDSASGNGKISSIPAVDGGGAPNCPKMIKQWRYIKDRKI